MERIISILIFLSFFSLSCSNDEGNVDNNIERLLVGQWEEVSPCETCSTIFFEENNNIAIDFQSEPEILRMSYIMEGNSIRVTRLWDIEEEKKSNLVNVNFKTDDSLELIQFYATDGTSTTGFNDVIFKKME